MVDSIPYVNPEDSTKPLGRESERLMSLQDRWDAFKRLMALRGLMEHYRPCTFERCTELPPPAEWALTSLARSGEEPVSSRS